MKPKDSMAAAKKRRPTRHDYFIGRALTGLLASSATDDTELKMICYQAIRIADMVVEYTEPL